MVLENILEKTYDFSTKILRESSKIVRTDPFGTFCVTSGSYSMVLSNLPTYAKVFLSGGVVAFGVYHLTNMLNQRKKFHEEATELGISPKLIDKYNRAALCARTMVKTYLKDHGHFEHSKDKLVNYSFGHYFEREKRRWKIMFKMLRKGKNPIKAIFK